MLEEIIKNNLKRSTPFTIAGLGIVLLFLANVSNFPFQLPSAALGFFLITAGSTVELYKYMQDLRKPGSSKTNGARRMPREKQDIRFVHLETAFTALKRRVDTLSEAATDIEYEIPEIVVQALLQRVKEGATDSIFSEWEKEYGRTAFRQSHLQEIRENVGGAIYQLEEEIQALGKRSSVQMGAGAAVSLVGFIVLGFFIYKSGDELGLHIDGKLIAYIFLRIGLIAMIELFALFFLRMYRYSVFEIKYFQNEISSIYLKSMALEVALLQEDKDSIKNIVSELISSERNLIMKKGDVSLSQLRDIAERDGDAVLINFIKSIPNSLSGVVQIFSKKTA